MSPNYYSSETIELTIKLKVSWKAGDEKAKEHAMEEARDIYVGSKSGCHVGHGCFRAERV